MAGDGKETRVDEGRTVVIVGHSLGTAVTSRLVGHLADRGMSLASLPVCHRSDLDSGLCMQMSTQRRSY